MRVVGAGVGRTGTLSLKLALERLLGAPCYHMVEVFRHPEHVGVWHAAAQGRMPDWRRFLEGYAAAVDWPAASFWPELAEAFPQAVVVHSVRDPEAWWRSASRTIFPTTREAEGPWRAMIDDVLGARFTARIHDRAACLDALARHDAAVRAGVAPERRVEWRAGDGWAPLCAALGLPVPDEPFPHVNRAEDFPRVDTLRETGGRHGGTPS